MPCLDTNSATIVVMVTVENNSLVYHQRGSNEHLPAYVVDKALVYPDLQTDVDAPVGAFDEKGNFNFPHDDDEPNYAPHCYNIFFYLNDENYEFYKFRPIEYWSENVPHTATSGVDNVYPPPHIDDCGTHILTPVDSYVIEPTIVYSHFVESQDADIRGPRNNLIGFTYHNHTTITTGDGKTHDTSVAWYRLVLQQFDNKKPDAEKKPVCLDDPGGHNGDRSNPMLTPEISVANYTPDVSRKISPARVPSATSDRRR